MLMSSWTYAQHPPSYYELLDKVMAKDTILNEAYKRLIPWKIEKGAMTKEDSIRFVGAIKSRSPKLFYKTVNSAFKKAIRQNSRLLEKHLPTAVITELEMAVPIEETQMDPNKISKAFGLFKKPISLPPKHYFSEAIKLDDSEWDYTLYHSLVMGVNIVHSYFIVYRIDAKGELQIGYLRVGGIS